MCFERTSFGQLFQKSSSAVCYGSSMITSQINLGHTFLVRLFVQGKSIINLNMYVRDLEASWAKRLEDLVGIVLGRHILHPG